MKKTTSIRCAWLAACAGSVLLGGCRGDRTDAPPHQFFPDLDDAPKWNPQTHSEFFADGRTMRVPPTHTVAFGRQGFVTEQSWGAEFMKQRADLLKENPLLYTGKEGDAWVVKAPIAFTMDDIKRGQERYGISCAPCHGFEGDGKGMVGRQWSYAVPSFHDDKYFDVTQPQGRDGYVFHTIRNGVAGGAPENPDWVNTKMPGYAHALSIDDSWRIVAYVRSLQESKRGSINDVPETQREKVRKEMDEAAKKAAAASAPPATNSTTNSTSGGTTGGGK
jgi:mono/diheme cytochrome c family protein